MRFHWARQPPGYFPTFLNWEDGQRNVLPRGAAGGIGTTIRPLLRAIYPGLVLSDIRPVLAAG